MNELHTTTSHHDHIRTHACSIHCISWTAIIMGAIVAVSFSFLLNLLGMAIGLSAFPDSPDGQTAFAAWGFAGLIILAILAMFPAGWVAGYLGRSHCLKRKIGELYGIGTWGLSLILTIFLAAHIGQFLAQSNSLMARNVMMVKVTDTVTDVMVEPKKNNDAIPEVKVNPKTASNALGIVSFASFFIFFIGLLACCFGGRLGMSCKCGTAAVNDHCPKC